ncbi:amidohydrolase family protein [Actinomadura sp. 3N407]|uniref:amidohydrolase family protein n=1 Tax=Actinomadura sp. 3N407 TaxID=3457423 RepID=UPI003FCD48CB
MTEPGLGPGHVSLVDGSGSQAAIDVLRHLASSGDLTMCVTVLAMPNGMGGGDAAGVKRHLDAGLADMFSAHGLDQRRLRCGGVKIFADGTPQNGTTWHKEPVHEGHRCGHLVLAGADDESRVEELRKIVRVVDDAGLQLAVHCIGDKTSEVVIDCLIELAAHAIALTTSTTVPSSTPKICARWRSTTSAGPRTR